MSGCIQILLLNRICIFEVRQEPDGTILPRQIFGIREAHDVHKDAEITNMCWSDNGRRLFSLDDKGVAAIWALEVLILLLNVAI
jgi:hypothetical protein